MSVLETFRTNFADERNRLNTDSFTPFVESGELNRSSNPVVRSMSSQTWNKYLQINFAYTSIVAWWDSYNSEVNASEISLAAMANSIYDYDCSIQDTYNNVVVLSAMSSLADAVFYQAISLTNQEDLLLITKQTIRGDYSNGQARRDRFIEGGLTDDQILAISEQVTANVNRGTTSWNNITVDDIPEIYSPLPIDTTNDATVTPIDPIMEEGLTSLDIPTATAGDWYRDVALSESWYRQWAEQRTDALQATNSTRDTARIYVLTPDGVPDGFEFPIQSPRPQDTNSIVGSAPQFAPYNFDGYVDPWLVRRPDGLSQATNSIIDSAPRFTPYNFPGWVNPWGLPRPIPQVPNTNTNITSSNNEAIDDLGDDWIIQRDPLDIINDGKFWLEFGPIDVPNPLDDRQEATGTEIEIDKPFDPREVSREIRTGETLFEDALIPFYHLWQDTGAWRNVRYGPSGAQNYDKAGCFPVTYAMIIRSLTGQVVCPTEVGGFISDNGGRGTSGGTQHYLNGGIPTTSGVIENWGLEANHIGRNVQAIRETLENGGLIFLSVGPNPTETFTGFGHAIALRGLTEDGQVIVACSARRRVNNNTFDLQFVLNHAGSGNVWAITRPGPQSQNADDRSSAEGIELEVDDLEIDNIEIDTDGPVIDDIEIDLDGLTVDIIEHEEQVSDVAPNTVVSGSIPDLSNLNNLSNVELKRARTIFENSVPLERGGPADAGMTRDTVITIFDTETGRTFQGTPLGNARHYHVDWNYLSEVDRAIAEEIAGGRSWKARSAVISFEGDSGNTYSFTASYHTRSHPHQCMHGADELSYRANDAYSRNMHNHATGAQDRATDWVQTIDNELERRRTLQSHSEFDSRE